MKKFFTVIIFIYIFPRSYGCQEFENDFCTINEDCCSNYCYREQDWTTGFCKPKTKQLKEVDKLKVIADHILGTVDLIPKKAEEFLKKFNFSRVSPDSLTISAPLKTQITILQTLDLNFSLDKCKSLVSEKLDITCYTPSNVEVPCNETLKADYRAVFDCNYLFCLRIKEPEYNEITCKNGIWDRPLLDDFCKIDECEPLVSEKLKISCFTPLNESTPCNQTLRTDSRAVFDCDYSSYVRVKKPEYVQITCKIGKWDLPLMDDFCEQETTHYLKYQREKQNESQGDIIHDVLEEYIKLKVLLEDAHLLQPLSQHTQNLNSQNLIQNANVDCQPLFSEKLNISCYTPSNDSTLCNVPMKTNSRATFQCNEDPYVKIKEPKYTEITCRDGAWYPPLMDDFCEADCGTSFETKHQPKSNWTTFYYVYNAVKSEIGEYPWHAGIYRFSNDEYKYICGGTIISPKVIISAAHCFYQTGQDRDYYQRPLDPEVLSKFKVEVGKFHYSFNDVRDAERAQTRNVVDVKTPGYRDYFSSFSSDVAAVILNEKLVYSWTVLPVCIDFSDKFQLTKGMRGTIVGWGLWNNTVRADELKQGQMPFVPKDECFSKIDDHWSPYYTHDKICAGEEKDEFQNVCQGDSGGGLSFPRKIDEKYKYYLGGVISLGPNSCDGQKAYALFTNLMTYKSFVEEYV